MMRDLVERYFMEAGVFYHKKDKDFKGSFYHFALLEYFNTRDTYTYVL